GQAALNAQFKPPEVPQAIRDRIAKLREDLTAANGQTKDFQKNRQMDDAQKSAAAAQELAGELNKLLGEGNQYELHTATALWVEKTFPLRPSFLETTKTYFGGAAFPVDFQRNYEVARGEINSWAAKQTNDRIKDLIPPGVRTDQTRLVITSAIYFKG